VKLVCLADFGHRVTTHQREALASPSLGLTQQQQEAARRLRADAFDAALREIAERRGRPRWSPTLMGAA